MRWYLGWQSGFQLWAETAKDEENWLITISVFVCLMSVIYLSRENLRTETAQDAEASPQQHHWCQTQGTCAPAQCVPVQCVPAQCVPVQCAPAQCAVCSCKVCTCTVYSVLLQSVYMHSVYLQSVHCSQLVNLISYAADVWIWERSWAPGLEL